MSGGHSLPFLIEHGPSELGSGPVAIVVAEDIHAPDLVADGEAREGECEVGEESVVEWVQEFGAEKHEAEEGGHAGGGGQDD